MIGITWQSLKNFLRTFRASDSLLLNGKDEKHYTNISPSYLSTSPNSLNIPFALMRHADCPNDDFWYVLNLSYINSDWNKAQIAISYLGRPMMHIRNYYAETWTEWTPCHNLTPIEYLEMLKQVDGEGSGISADTVRGYGISSKSMGWRLALRDADGDLTSRLFRCSYPSDSPSSLSSLGNDTSFMMRNSESENNNYVRPISIIETKKILGIETTFGAIGSFAMLESTTSTSGIVAGSTHAGSTLRYTGFNSNTQHTYVQGGNDGLTVRPLGSWQAYGNVSDDPDNTLNPATIFRRIA